MTDVVWKYWVDILDNGKKVKCNYCSATSNERIFSFKYHLVYAGYDSEPCTLVP